jgi:acetolactate synthase-1/2/3 large subunit
MSHLSCDRTGAEIMCEALIRHGVEVIFGIPGGAIMPFYHALPQYETDLRHVLCRHEQGAGHAAEGYARASGRVGVCVATSGPGATNLVTPIANAWMDSTPLVAITGQVSSALLGSDAFQEVDFVGLTLPITKQSYLVRDANDLPRVFAEAFHLATSGRPGPVVIDVAKDVQKSRVVPNWTVRLDLPGYADHRLRSVDLAGLRETVDLLVAADRPLILAGYGVIQAGAHFELLAFAERTGIPVATTLHGLGAFPQDHPLSLGMAGMHGGVHVNRAIQRCDLLINVGSRFDDRVTGKASTFARNARIVHIDIEPAEIGKTVRADVAIIGDARRVLAALTAATVPGCTSEWLAQVRSVQTRHDTSARYQRDGATVDLTPHDLFAGLRRALATRDDARVVTDVGQHQMWAAQLLEWRRPRSQLTSGGAGTMGFAVPAALGAAIACPDETIWVVVGDGGFQMTNQELATIAQEDIRNLKIAIVNNGYLGMVRQWQELFEGRRYSGTRLSSPSFARLAEAYGIHGVTVEHRDDVDAAIAAAWAHSGAVVIDFVVEREANVFPIVPQGRAIGDMMTGGSRDVVSVE